MALENPEGDSEGYILEKGLKETFVELKVKARALLKFGQVDPNAEGSSEATDAEKAATPATPAATS